MSATPAPQGTPQSPRFHSVPAAARILGVSPMTLYRLIAQAEFPAIRIGTRIVIPAATIDEMATAAIKTGTIVDSAEWASGRQTSAAAHE